MEKGELLFEGKENTSSVNIREFTPQGARLDFTLAGHLSGKIGGLIMSTHNALLKANGTAEADLRSVIFASGEPVFMWGKVSAKLVDPTPITQIEADVNFQTPSQKLGYLNTTKGWVEGRHNFATGEFKFKAYAVK